MNNTIDSRKWIADYTHLCLVLDVVMFRLLWLCCTSIIFYRYIFIVPPLVHFFKNISPLFFHLITAQLMRFD